MLKCSSMNLESLNPQTALEFRGVVKIYEATPPLRVLDGVSFNLARGAFAALIGPSGSGKSTLLNLASGLDRASEGKIYIGGHDVTHMSQKQLSDFRAHHVGFVFQSYNLFPVLTALENVEYTSIIRGDNPQQARTRAQECLKLVGLSDKFQSFPTKLSGGQQQRVAVARALATEPDIIFADEPTANLDSKTAAQLIDLFVQLNERLKVTFLFSTHDMNLVEKVKHRFAMKDGQLLPYSHE
jgi:putative ABC transport system ATP-binding protein